MEINAKFYFKAKNLDNVIYLLDQLEEYARESKRYIKDGEKCMTVNTEKWTEEENEEDEDSDC